MHASWSQQLQWRGVCQCRECTISPLVPLSNPQRDNNNQQQQHVPCWASCCGPHNTSMPYCSVRHTALSLMSQAGACWQPLLTCLSRQNLPPHLSQKSHRHSLLCLRLSLRQTHLHCQVARLISQDAAYWQGSLPHTLLTN